MTWVQTTRRDAAGNERLSVYCEQIKEVVLTEDQVLMFSKEFVDELCRKHNEALYSYGKWFW